MHLKLSVNIYLINCSFADFQNLFELRIFYKVLQFHHYSYNSYNALIKSESWVIFHFSYFPELQIHNLPTLQYNNRYNSSLPM